MNETKITKKQLLSKLQDISDRMDVTDDPDTVDKDLVDMVNSVNTYDTDLDTGLSTHLEEMMDDNGIANHDTLLSDLKDEKQKLEDEGEEGDPEYPTVCDNISYLEGGASDYCFVGPEWHVESYGTFTGDRSHYDAVHGETVRDMADELIKELNGDDDSEY